MRPFVGMLVHFHASCGHPLAAEHLPAPEAAIITVIHAAVDEGAGQLVLVDLEVFREGCCDRYRRYVPYSDRPAGGHWSLIRPGFAPAPPG